MTLNEYIEALRQFAENENAGDLEVFSIDHFGPTGAYRSASLAPKILELWQTERRTIKAAAQKRYASDKNQVKWIPLHERAVIL